MYQELWLGEEEEIGIGALRRVISIIGMSTSVVLYLQDYKTFITASQDFKSSK